MVFGDFLNETKKNTTKTTNYQNFLNNFFYIKIETFSLSNGNMNMVRV